MSINEVVLYVFCDDVFFGGVGDFGIGYYYGYEGFKVMSKVKIVLKCGKFYFGKFIVLLYDKGFLCFILKWLFC